MTDCSPSAAPDHANSLPPTPGVTPGGNPGGSRRAFLLAGIGVLLGGCASTGSTARRPLPGPAWEGSRSAALSMPAPPATGSGPAIASGPIPGVRSRSEWALDAPVLSRIRSMGRINRLTIHHDAVQISDASEIAARARLEQHRRYHVQGSNWADIGYHYAVDPAGRVWEGRALHYQGAHVGGQNEGNVGVMLMGNFEVQQPTEMQIVRMHELVAALVVRHRISPREIRTHREYDVTNLCPGRTLHARVMQSRAAGRLGVV